MNESQLLEDVEFVRQMIENNRRALVDNGITYIATGVYVVIGAICSTVLAFNGYEHWIPGYWLTSMVLLIGFTIVVQQKVQKVRVKKTFATQIFSAVWMACGIPVMIVSIMFFLGIAGSLGVQLACVSACMGIGYYLTGVINELRFMKILAAVWWAAVAVALCWSRFGKEYQLGLLFSLLILLLEVVPGVVIYRKWKHTAHE